MKPYTVVGLNPHDLFDMGGPREARFTYWAHAHYEKDINPGDYNGKVNVYFCDTEQAAAELAKYLSSKAANIYWMVAKNMHTFQSAPGPVKQGKFTDKGLLPV
jgi:hypothetical protein